jgi:hypothetical protein
MAQVISGTDYASIATSYANARTAVLSSVSYLFEAVYTIVQLDVVEPEVDLLTEFFQSYQINSDLFRSPVSFLSAVRRLNNHVLNRGGVTSVATYLTDEGVTIPQAWADLSAAAGYDLSSVVG